MNIDGKTLVWACISTGLISIGITLLILGDSASTQTEINQGLLEVDKGFLEVSLTQTKLNSGFIEVDKLLMDKMVTNQKNIQAIYKHLQENP